MTDDKNTISKKSLLIMILSILTVISVGTYAWLSYRSNDTSMVLTIGDINKVQVTLSPYQINTSIISTQTYTTNPYTSITARNNRTTPRDLRLFYKINSIDPALKIAAFKYTIERSTDSGSTYTSYKTGNFTSATVTADMDILSETLPASTTYYYKVYIWLDSAGSNQASASGKTLDCELRAAISEDQ